MEWLAVGGLALVGVTLVAVLLLMQLKSHIATAPPLPVIGPIADFTLTNQNGRAVSLADLRGHVWVADIIFTRCAGPLPENDAANEGDSRSPAARQPALNSSR